MGIQTEGLIPDPGLNQPKSRRYLPGIYALYMI